MGHELLREPLARGVEQRGERLSRVGQMTVDGAPVDAEAAGDLLDGASAGGQQGLDEFAHPVRDRGVPGSGGDGVEVLPGVVPQLRVRHGVGGVEVVGVEDDAVELAVELDPGAEQAAVPAGVRRRAVGEPHGQGLPARVEESSQDAGEGAHDQFRGLPGRRRLADPEVHLDGGQAVPLGQARVQELVVHVLVAQQQCQCTAYVGFLADDQADGAQVGEAAQLGHAQAEVVVVRGGRGDLQEADGGRTGDPPVLDGEVRGVQPHALHQRARVDAEGAAQLDVAVQRCGADEGPHRNAPGVRSPEVKFPVPARQASGARPP